MDRSTARTGGVVPQNLPLRAKTPRPQRTKALSRSDSSTRPAVEVPFPAARLELTRRMEFGTRTQIDSFYMRRRRIFRRRSLTLLWRSWHLQSRLGVTGHTSVFTRRLGGGVVSEVGGVRHTFPAPSSFPSCG
jgi:hypothetical protein